MKFRIALAAAVVATVTLVAASDAEARRGWRRARTATYGSTYRSAPRARGSYSSDNAYQRWQQAGRRNNGPPTYSGIFRGEQDAIERQEAWFELRTGGFRLVDFL